jgi:hypothetical protein
MPFEQWSSLISGQKKSFFSAEEIRIGLHGTKRNQTDTQSIGLLFSPVLSNVEVAPPPPKPLPVVASCSSVSGRRRRSFLSLTIGAIPSGDGTRRARYLSEASPVEQPLIRPQLLTPPARVLSLTGLAWG